jgi:hypothetical protein
MTLKAAERPCQECPWRRDVATGRFDEDRFRSMARTARDMDRRLFQCHRTDEGRPLVCAGFLERGAEHNLAVRLAYARGDLNRKDRSGSLPLYADYREMAVANGVAPDDPALSECRTGR